MAMYDPISLPPNADEQDFIQAYENVREKYKVHVVDLRLLGAVLIGTHVGRQTVSSSQYTLEDMDINFQAKTVVSIDLGIDQHRR
ncbi:hypothetical protein QTP86_032655 [Hemibagrus guttatus]|nr:hypothetical protein QTP86_032655 [Hemibagrus guttatus]